LYVHIPFCARKCFYCDFNAYVIKGPDRIAAYVDDVLAEADLHRRDPQVAGATFHTVFLGGGTPSRLPPAGVVRLLEGLGRRLSILPGAEITLEANPEDVSPEALVAWRRAGVNRLSMGVQAFQDDLLSRLGRNHDAAAALRAYRQAREAGFTNINVDLMFGLPGQTLAQWEETLTTLLRLDPPPDHVSVYGLQVEPRTTFWRWERENRLPRPGEEEEAAMYETAMDRLAAAGYDHYEISNFARDGKYAEHNLAVWHFLEYLGLGAGAWSFWGGRRWANAGFLRPYTEAVRAGRLPVAQRDEPRDERTAMGEMVLLGTRLLRGLDLDAFRRRFGREPTAVFRDALAYCRRRGWVAVVDDHLRLTREGLMVANNVWAEFLA